MLETHGMLRSDTTALFERLREANILLQEVLSGAHENMSTIEHTMVHARLRVRLRHERRGAKTGATNARSRSSIGSFHDRHRQGAQRPRRARGQFDTHGRSLAEAVDLLERSNRRPRRRRRERQTSIETLVTTLDTRTGDFERAAASASPTCSRSRSIRRRRRRARSPASSPRRATTSARTIEQQFELVRTTPRKSASAPAKRCTRVYEQAAGDSPSVFSQPPTASPRSCKA